MVKSFGTPFFQRMRKSKNMSVSLALRRIGLTIKSGFQRRHFFAVKQKTGQWQKVILKVSSLIRVSSGAFTPTFISTGNVAG